MILHGFLFVELPFFIFMDKVSPEIRSHTMAAVKSYNTKPEVAVRKLLHSLGYRFRLQRKDLPGRPDIVLPKYKIAIFVNGCFWHRHEGCKRATMPTSHLEYWEPKFARNIMRDKENYRKLEALGWSVRIIWECEINSILKNRLVPGLPQLK